MALVEAHAAHNYSPLPVVAASAEVRIADIDGLRYSGLAGCVLGGQPGHRNLTTAHAQVDTVTC